VSLLELVVGMGLLTGIVAAVMMAFGRFSTVRSNQTRAEQVDSELRLIGNAMQKYLNGSRNFESPSFRIPGTTLNCKGAGFCVEPDRDFSGAPSPGNDLIYVLVRAVSATELRFSSAFAGGATLPIATTDATKNVGDDLTMGDFLVLSNIRSAELLRIAVPPPPGASIDLPLPATPQANSFAPTFTSPQGSVIRGTYVAGDTIYKGLLLKIGLDTVSREVRSVSLSNNEVRVLGRGVSRFSLSYAFPEGSAAPDPCLALVTPNGEQARTGWGVIATNQCYPFVAAVRLDLEAGDRAPAGEPSFVGAVKSASYVFKTAN
jgi:hypothetical protein